MCGCNGAQATAVQADDGTASPSWIPVIGFVGVVGAIAVMALAIGGKEEKYRAANPKKPLEYGGKFVTTDCANPPCPRKLVPGAKMTGHTPMPKKRSCSLCNELKKLR